MMRLLPLLLGLILPGCAGHGAEGVPIPAPIDFGQLVRPATPNTALAAPAGFRPAPDIVTRRYEAAPALLYAAIRAVAASQPRVFPHIAYDARMQAHYVARSAILNFPDLVAVQVTPDSQLIIWSRSVYGRSDFGVNRKRVQTWLAALDAELAKP
jgi:uncharacterized protein (DUF1499 family)